MKYPTISLTAAIMQCLEASGETDQNKGIELFIDNQKAIAEASCAYAVGLATRDDKLECSPYRQLAKAALELALMLENGIDISAAMNKLLDDSNRLMTERLNEAVTKGQKININKISFDEDGVKVKKGTTEDVKKH